ncbi:hypothetical protein ASPFODRAFT_60576 [Aspergillus luchuensis CBS 106.47]|uniref:Uncharacterized protein n=1 Tax=Aspergillus luchuensis (strain CBS 106.47) TaxID=1137211 RepID=A0A1M3TIU3_ASPLC|nr:hypothetical protein ASPFODRAFT_60576 [Aspergillus luchuensis CBS 106.47]GAA85047.1 hypothetical protein AKAW_03161 [Aspergillus luchuensis IFO 4308]
MDSNDEYDFTVFTSDASHSHSSDTFFEAKKFKRTGSDDLASHLVSRIDQAEALGQSLLTIIQLHDYTRAVITVLESAITGFPPDLLQNVVYSASTGQRVCMIPRARKDSSDIRFLINYPLATLNERALVGFLPLGAWICPSSVVRGSAGHRTTIFLICTDQGVPGLVASHFASYPTQIQYARWLRLQKQPLWIFADLLHVFGDWSQVWNVTKGKLIIYHHDIHTYPLTRPLLDLTRGLHEEAAKVLSVREQLRVHASALTRFLHLEQVKGLHELAERVQEHFDDINYHEETSQVILRQLDNMMSLAFNIETMTQGQAVARLNVLAFAFLPISWVASIFGMTQFSISAAWYPLWACLALLVVFLVPFALPMRGIYTYVLGLSTMRWSYRKTSGSASMINVNDSLSTPSEVIHAKIEGPEETPSYPPFLLFAQAQSRAACRALIAAIYTNFCAPGYISEIFHDSRGQAVCGIVWPWGEGAENIRDRGIPTVLLKQPDDAIIASKGD